MRLLEVKTRDQVKGETSTGSTTFLNSVAGWSLSLEGGMVHARHGECVRLIPLSNVVFMVPLAEEAKKK
jgi:hypothetical protein